MISERRQGRVPAGRDRTEPETLGQARLHTATETDGRLTHRPKPQTHRQNTRNLPRHWPEAGAKSPFPVKADIEERPQLYADTVNLASACPQRGN